MHFYFPVPLPYTFSSSPGRERHPATLQTKPPGCRARPPPRQAAPRPPADLGPLTPSKRMNRGLSGSSDHPGGPPPAPARRDTARRRRHRHHRGLPPVPAPLTQQQPGLHDADLEVGAEVLHVSAAAAGRRRRLLLLLHLQAGATPRLDDPPACQRRYAGALLPQVGPREAADLLGKGVHGPDTHRRSPRDSRLTTRSLAAPALPPSASSGRCARRPAIGGARAAPIGCRLPLATGPSGAVPGRAVAGARGEGPLWGVGGCCGGGARYGLFPPGFAVGRRAWAGRYQGWAPRPPSYPLRRALGRAGVGNKVPAQRFSSARGAERGGSVVGSFTGGFGVSQKVCRCCFFSASKTGRKLWVRLKLWGFKYFYFYFMVLFLGFLYGCEECSECS